MKYRGRARQAALKLIFWSLVALIGIFLASGMAMLLAAVIGMASGCLLLLWAVFVLFTLYFFRDPEPKVPAAPGLVVAPAHGKVDVIDQSVEPLFMGGECRRISIFLSVFDVHVQYAPVSGRVAFYKYTEGEFLNALKTESAERNENLLLGLEAGEPAGARVGVRLIAGVLARRIVPFASQTEEVARGGRISMIQFGSRTDLYLPLSAKIRAKVGDRVVGGETILAAFE
jgi:phosphatidylserine decarboxylase